MLYSKSQPLVSIVIPSHNMAHLLGDVLDSVLSQTYDNWECIVVDDGSTDNTSEVVERYRVSDSRLRYIYQPAQGPSAARNAGINVGEGPLIAFVDADDIWLERKIEMQVNLLSANRNAGLCCAYYEEVDGQLQTLLTWDEIQQRDQYPAHISAKSMLVDLNKCVVPGSSSAVVVRRECLEKSGLFDSDLRVGEDLDLWYRIALQTEIIIVPEVLVKVRKYPKEIDIRRVNKSLEYVVRKMKRIAPNKEHTALIANAQFDYRWGILGECLRRRMALFFFLSVFILISKQPIRFAEAIVGKLFRSGRER